MWYTIGHDIECGHVNLSTTSRGDENPVPNVHYATVCEYTVDDGPDRTYRTYSYYNGTIALQLFSYS